MARKKFPQDFLVVLKDVHNFLLQTVSINLLILL